MAGRFPIYADADVRGPLIKALKKAGWDVVRAIDLYPERTPDLTHFERAVAMGRILVTNDEDQEQTADEWYREGRPFPGVVAWRQKVYDQMTYGDLVTFFDGLAAQEKPFSPYPILHPKA